MPKSEAQKAARRAKRQAGAAALKQMKEKSTPKVQGHGDYQEPKKKKKKNKHKNMNGGGIRGSGDYKSDSKTGKSWGKVAGQAGDLINSIFGTGDYTLKKNSLMTAEGPPSFAVGKDRHVEMVHREYVGEIFGTTNFNLQTWIISPTNSSLYPWLCNMASLFEEWELDGQVAEFKTLSGSVVSTQALGSVTIATQYDVYDPNFASKVEMNNYEYATSSAPDVSFFHGMECARELQGTPIMYVDAPVKQGLSPDLRLSQFGRLSVATSGNPTTNSLGELWISYHVKFFKPKLNPGASVSTLTLKDTTLPGVSFFSAGNATTVIDTFGSVWTTALQQRGLLGTYILTPNNITFTDPRLGFGVAGPNGLLPHCLAINLIVGANTTVTGLPTVNAVTSGGVTAGTVSVVYSAGASGTTAGLVEMIAVTLTPGFSSYTIQLTTCISSTGGTNYCSAQFALTQ